MVFNLVSLKISPKATDDALGSQFSTRWSFFWYRKVFEGVHSHVMSLLRKSDFGPFNFLFEIFDHVSKSDFGPLSIVRIPDFGPDSYFESKLEQNRKFELLKSGAKSELDT